MSTVSIVSTLSTVGFKRRGLCAIMRTMKDEASQVQDRWWQILPLGVSLSHEVCDGAGRRVPAEIVTPPAALERVAEAFRAGYREPGVLVDADHASVRPEGSTRALGWVKALEVRADGLYGKIHFTPHGLALVRGGEYVNRSPAFDVVDLGGGRYEPARLTSLALTNTPAFESLKVACCTALRATEQHKETEMDPKAIAQQLGLPDEATPAEIIAELSDKLARLRDLEEAAAKQAEAEAKAEEEAFMEECKKQSVCAEDCEELRTQFRANPQAARKLLAIFSKAAATRLQPPATPGRTLGANQTPPKATASRLSAASAQARDRYVAEVREALKCSCSMAWSEARARRPELFV